MTTKIEKFYISGGIKDVPDYLENFKRGAENVNRWATAVNPCELDHPATSTYEDFMREDIRALLDCDGIYMLRDWAKSRGARLEHDVAVAIGLEVIYE